MVLNEPIISIFSTNQYVWLAKLEVVKQRKFLNGVLTLRNDWVKNPWHVHNQGELQPCLLLSVFQKKWMYP